MIQTMLSMSDLLIIQQALEEYGESEYAGEVDLNRSKIALGRVRAHLALMEQNGRKVSELRCADGV